MKDDEIALAVCSHATAKMLMKKDPDVIDALVITNVINDGTAILVSKQEFLEYLEGKDKKDSKVRE